MEEVNKILKLIIKILFKPRKTASEHSLGNYDMKAMNYFIFFISILFWISIMDFTLLNDNKFIFVVLIILGSILMPVLILILKKIIVNIYKTIINSGLEFEVTFSIMEKILNPYILTGLILALVLNILKKYFILIKGVIGLALLLWFNLQIYLNIIYRIKTIDKNKINLIIIKILVFVISLLILQSGVFLLEKTETLDYIKNKNKWNNKNIGIRVEVYEDCREILNEIEKMQADGKGISSERLNEVISTIHHITLFKIVSPLRENESKLIKTIRRIAELNKKWYESKLKGDEKYAKELLKNYNNAIKTAYCLIENFYQKQH